jgi:hypothetical protein
MQKRLIIFLALLIAFLLFSHQGVLANSCNVIFSQDVILDLGSSGETLYIEAGSQADSLTISGNTLDVFGVCADSFFSIKTADHKVLRINPSGETADFTVSSDYLVNGYIEQWTAVSTVTTNFIIGTSAANSDYFVKANGIKIPGNPFNSGPNSEVSFSRAGSGVAEVYTIGGEGLYCGKHNVWGHAWSDNIGWISFSCENESEIGQGVDYGVDIEEDTGIFSGYAWSSSVGWIGFAPEGPYPDAPDHSAKVNLQTGDVTGWARALSYGDDWDGWISMSGDNYGVIVDFNAGELFDYAWSDEVIGWLSFNCENEEACGTSDYKVLTSFSPAPSITNFSNTFPAPCSQSRIPTFSWETDADLPYDYEIRLCGNSDCTNPGDPLVSELVESTSSTSWAPACVYTCSTSPYNNISFGGGTYYGQVRARDLGGRWSDWAVSGFTTYSHAYPYPDFLCDGANCEEMQIYEDVIVTLTDSSTTYDGLVSCSWTLPAIAEVVEGNPASDCELQVKFSPPPPGQRMQDIEFSLTDSSSYSCSATESLEIRFPLPEYKEAPPVSWLKNLFANLFNKVASVFASF